MSSKNDILSAIRRHTGKRYDMGNKLGVMEAQVETALKHPEIGPAFRAYLKELSKTL